MSVRNPSQSTFGVKSFISCGIVWIIKQFLFPCVQPWPQKKKDGEREVEILLPVWLSRASRRRTRPISRQPWLWYFPRGILTTWMQRVHSPCVYTLLLSHNSCYKYSKHPSTTSIRSDSLEALRDAHDLLPGWFLSYFSRLCSVVLPPEGPRCRVRLNPEWVRPFHCVLPRKAGGI